MRRHAIDAHPRPQAALVCDDRAVRGGLADDSIVDPRARRSEMLCALARRFLVGNEDAKQRPGPARAVGAQEAHGLDHSDERPLSVASAAPIKLPVRLAQREGIGRPALAGGDDVQVRIKREGRSRAIIEPRHDIAAAGLVLVDRDRETFPFQPLGKESARPRFHGREGSRS